MIVVRRAGALWLIKQLDHAALAGEFAREWGNQEFEAPAPSSSVVLAAARHDEGWRGSDDEYRYDPQRQAPLNFLDATLEDYLELYGAGIERIAALDPYAGILTSMHGTGNLCGRWGLQPGVRLTRYEPATWTPKIEAFVLRQEALQARLKLDLLGVTPERPRSAFERGLWFNWELLQAWDRLSLLICRADPEAGVAAAIDSVPVAVYREAPAELDLRGENGRATLTPWPFRASELEIEVPVLRIADRPYESRDAMLAAVTAARTERISWTLQRGDPAGPT